MSGNKTVRMPGWLASALVPGLLAILLYWPTIHAELVWDDTELVNKYELLSSSSWFDHSFHRSFISDSYYRPLPLATLFANAAWGSALLPPLAHITNLILLLANTALVMLLVRRAQPQPDWLGPLAGLFYVVHPALIEPVAWVSGRCDLLATCFILLALWFDRALLSRPWIRLFAVCVCFFLAALSKEVAAVFPALWCVWQLYNDDETAGVRQVMARPGNRALLIALVATGIGYLLFRYYMLGFLPFLQTSPGDIRDFGSLLNRFLLVGKTFCWYWILQLFPHYELSVVYPSRFPVPVNDRTAWIGVAFMLVAVIVLCSRFIRAHSKYALVGMLLLFLPVSNLKPVPVVDNFISLRFVLLPLSFGLVAFTPIAFRFLRSLAPRLRSILVVMLGLWVISSVANLYVTIPLWTKEVYLWRWVTQTKPESYIAWENYASRLYELGQFQACIDAEQSSLQYYQDKPRTYINLALCHDAMSRRDLARQDAAQALQLDEKLRREPDMYSFLLTLYAYWSISELPARDAAHISAETREQLAGVLANARLLDPSNRNAYLLAMAWCVITGDDAGVRQVAAELHHKGFELQAVLAQMARLKILDETQKQRVNRLIAEVYNAP